MRTLKLLREQAISHCVKVKNWKCSFFRVFFQRQVLFKSNLIGTSSSYQKQTTQIRQPRYFVTLRATWTNVFLNQQAMFTTMKSRVHFLISNRGARWKFHLSTPMGATKMHEQIQNTGMTKKIIKTYFSTTQQATNFNNVQIELVLVITATKLFLRNQQLLFHSYLMWCFASFNKG